MNLFKSANRGEFKVDFGSINGILFGKWKYNKVVSFISMLSLVENGTTVHQCGSKKVQLSCPKVLQAFNQFWDIWI